MATNKSTIKNPASAKAGGANHGTKTAVRDGRYGEKAGHSNVIDCGFHSHQPTTKGTAHEGTTDIQQRRADGHGDVQHAQQARDCCWMDDFLFRPRSRLAFVTDRFLGFWRLTSRRGDGFPLSASTNTCCNCFCNRLFGSRGDFDLLESGQMAKRENARRMADRIPAARRERVVISGRPRLDRLASQFDESLPIRPRNVLVLACIDRRHPSLRAPDSLPDLDLRVAGVDQFRNEV